MSPWFKGFVKPLKWGFGVAVVTAVFSLFTPNYYTSVAKVLPGDKGLESGLGNLASAAAAFGIGLPSADSGEATFQDILSSRWLRESLLDTRFRFHVRQWRFGPEVEREQTLSEFLKVKNRDLGVIRLATVISVSRDTKTKVLTLSAETASPELSQLILRKSLEYLDQFIHQKVRTRGGARAQFAEARLSEARREMQQAEDAFRAFLEANRNYLASSDPGVKLAGARLEGEFKLRTQLVTTLSLSREQALLEEKNNLPVLNVLDPGNLPIEKSGPSRLTLVLFVFALSSAGIWAFGNRKLLVDGLFSKE